MISQFYFKGFNPEEALQFEANQVLDRVIERAPYESTVVALLEMEAEQYRCAIDVYSRLGPFIAQSGHPNPLLALHAAERMIGEKLKHWRESRFTAPDAPGGNLSGGQWPAQQAKGRSLTA